MKQIMAEVNQGELNETTLQCRIRNNSVQIQVVLPPSSTENYYE
jgi:hypothetical protein